jgi:hypothetical protein
MTAIYLDKSCAMAALDPQNPEISELLLVAFGLFLG